jgi:RNA polymerase sigma-70 factor (ECF subfamily)
MDLAWSQTEPTGLAGDERELDDSRLLALARAGDARAFSVLYRRYLDRVYDYAASRLGSREAAEDAAQSTFLRVVAALPRCREDTIFAGWLFAIARNVVIDAHRARQRLVGPLDEALELRDPGDTPEELLLQDERSRELSGARERCLSPAEREVLDLRLQGLSDREIAAALGRSHGAVRSAQYRLIQKLRWCLRVAGEPKGADRADA